MLKWLVRAAVVALSLALPAAGWCIPADKPSHMDKFLNPGGCASCHGGRGLPGTPLLQARPLDLCFRCHGSDSQGGRGKKDIEYVLHKTSRHPIIETSQYHSVVETLPADRSEDPRHVACNDCHWTHRASPGNPTAGIRGYRPSKVREDGRQIGPTGLRLHGVDRDYELCYLCHADSANLPYDRKNVAMQFDPANASYHPVEMPGRNRYVPSLVRELKVTDMIGCGGCHGNSDKNGPRGPHGSDYAPILSGRYEMDDGPESGFRYELCYRCHDRISILNDESFKRHKLHAALKQIACSKCHSAHGSQLNKNLIEFSTLDVSASASGEPLYAPGAYGQPKCILVCHQVDHQPTIINVPGRGLVPWPW